SESITQAIPKDPGTPRPGISARQVFSLKPDRSRQRIQPPTRLLQTTRTPTSLTDQVLRQRGTPESGLSSRRQRNRQDLPNNGLTPRDAAGRLQERGPSHARHPERVGCLLRILRQQHSTARPLPRLRKLRPFSRLHRRVPELRQKGSRRDRS